MSRIIAGLGLIVAGLLHRITIAAEQLIQASSPLPVKQAQHHAENRP